MRAPARPEPAPAPADLAGLKAAFNELPPEQKKAFHEYAFSLMQPSLRASFGRCMLFFLAQAPVVTLERILRARLSVPPPFRSSRLACTIAWTIVLVPLAPLFMHVADPSWRLHGKLWKDYHVTPW